MKHLMFLTMGLAIVGGLAIGQPDEKPKTPAVVWGAGVVTVMPEELPAVGDVLRVEARHADTFFMGYYHPEIDSLPVWQANTFDPYPVEQIDFPDWEVADQVCGIDNRMTDHWCDIAAGE